MEYLDLFPMSDVLLLAAICQLVIFILFLALNRNGDWSLNLILSLVLSFQIVPAISSFILFHSFQIDYFPLAHIGNASFFCLGPLLFLYLRKYLTDRFFRWKTDAIHAGLFLIALAVFVTLAIEQGNNYMRRSADTFLSLVLFVYLLAYSILSFHFVVRNRRSSVAAARPLFWPVFLIAGSLILLFGRFVIFFIWELKTAHNLSPLTLEFFYMLSPYTVSAYFMLFFFFSCVLFLLALSGVHVIRNQPKYKRSRLSAEGKIRTERRLREIMDTDRPWLDPLLSLSGLARRLNVSSKELSQIINERCAMNFADFINSFRVREVVRIFESDAGDRTVLDISLDAGFNSKSAFNHAFKKHTGQSPRDYLKKNARNAG